MTPKEGHKLVVRSSKLSGAEEYSVDAVEIVSFGSAHFYRSTERPKPFLLSVMDYEVVEVRESRVSLKTTGIEKSIKIGGGKKEAAESVSEEFVSDEDIGKQPEKKRERKRNRRRSRRLEEAEESLVETSVAADPYDTFMEVESGVDADKLVTAPSEPVIAHTMSTLLPPPPTLISETMGRAVKEEPLPLFEAPQTPEERVEELLTDITED